MAAKGENVDKRVMVELTLVKEMTGRLSSRKIEGRWVKLLGEKR